MYEGNVDVIEYVNWKDGGCDLHPACLECPLPKCIEEEPRGRQRRRLKCRAEAMKEMRGQGRSGREIAGAFGVSTRTVQRALQGRNNGNGHKHNKNSKSQIPNKGENSRL